jgi:hypothetical protein
LTLGDVNAGYTMARQAGMSIVLVRDLFHTTNNRPSGRRGFFSWARIGATASSTTPAGCSGTNRSLLSGSVGGRAFGFHAAGHPHFTRLGAFPFSAAS